MKRLKKEWKDFIKEYGWKAFLDALSGGLVFATLAFIPVFLILGELIAVFMHLKDWFFALIVLFAMAYFVTINRLALQALKLKKPDHQSNPEYLIKVNSLVWAGIALVIGVVFMVFQIPILWV